MSRSSRIAAGALALALVLPAALSAQDRALVIYGGAGASTPTTSLVDNATDAKFKTGFAATAGLGLDVTKYFRLRADGAWADAKVKATSSFSPDAKFNKFFYGAEGVAQYPTAGGFTPFVGLGAGAVTLDPKATGAAGTTKFAGRGSIGFEYRLPKSRLGLFAQGTGWLYKFENAGTDKTQLDLVYTAGLSYRFAL